MMENSYRYEAAVLGNGLAALFAGYLLKKNRIRFVILDDTMMEVQKQNPGTAQKFPYEISEEGKNLVREVYQKIAAQVGIMGENLPAMDTDMNEEMVRMKTFLRSELKDELSDKKTVTEITLEKESVLLKCGEQTLDADVLIFQNEVMSAGNCAQAVMEEKQRRLERYMKRLRIRQGKRTHRKMVYVTHSKSWFYAREIVTQFAVKQGVAAVNPFMNYNFYMNGTVDRDEVVECCHQLIRTCDELWVFGPVSEAILTDIAVAVMEGKEVRFFSISDEESGIHELRMEDIIFEREVHAGQIRKSDLLNFIQSMTPRNPEYVQMSLFDGTLS